MVQMYLSEAVGNVWQTWIGKRVKAPFDDDDIYISTKSEDWSERLAIWKEAYLKDKKTDCPYPMPDGHMMFQKRSSYKDV